MKSPVISYNKGKVPIMNIEEYSFGRVVIARKTYTADVLVFPDRVYSAWRRKEGHKLQTADLADVIREKPAVLIVGTGYSGLMSVPEETVRHLESLGIRVQIERTSRAVEVFNAMQAGKKVIAALHLTC